MLNNFRKESHNFQENDLDYQEKGKNVFAFHNADLKCKYNHYIRIVTSSVPIYQDV